MTLSTKIDDAGHFLHSTKVVRVKDLKDFIKKIKERIDNPEHEIDCGFSTIARIIDEEAGDLNE